MDSTSPNDIMSSQNTHCKKASKKPKKKNKRSEKKRSNEFGEKSSESVDQIVLCNENTKCVDFHITSNVSDENCFSEDFASNKKQKTEQVEQKKMDTYEESKKIPKKKRSKGKKSEEQKSFQPSHVSGHDTNSSCIDTELEQNRKSARSMNPVISQASVTQKAKQVKFPSTPWGNDKLPCRKPAFRNNTSQGADQKIAENQQTSKAEENQAEIVSPVTEHSRAQSTGGQTVQKPPTKEHEKIVPKLDIHFIPSKGKGRAQVVQRLISSNSAFNDDQEDESSFRQNKSTKYENTSNSENQDQSSAKDLSTNEQGRGTSLRARRWGNVSVENKNQSNDHQCSKHDQYKNAEVDNRDARLLKSDTSDDQIAEESKSRQKNQQKSFPKKEPFSQVENPTSDKYSRPSEESNIAKYDENKATYSGVCDQSRSAVNFSGGLGRGPPSTGTQQRCISTSEPPPCTLRPPPGLGYSQIHGPVCPPPGFRPPPGFENETPINTSICTPDERYPKQGFKERGTSHDFDKSEKFPTKHRNRLNDRSSERENSHNSEKSRSRGHDDHRNRSSYSRTNKTSNLRDNRRTDYGNQSVRCHQSGDHRENHDHNNRTHGDHVDRGSARLKHDVQNKSYDRQPHNRGQRYDQRENNPRNAQRYDNDRQKSYYESQPESKTSPNYKYEGSNRTSSRSHDRSYKNDRKDRNRSHSRNYDRLVNAYDCTCALIQPQNVQDNWEDGDYSDSVLENISQQLCDYCKKKTNRCIDKRDEKPSLHRSGSRNKEQKVDENQTISKKDHNSRSRKNEHEDDRGLSRSRSGSSFTEKDLSCSSSSSQKVNESSNKVSKQPTRNHKNKADFEYNRRPEPEYKKNRNKQPLFVPNRHIFEPVIREIEGDLFQVSEEYSLAHCVAADLLMGAGIAVKFRKLFGGVDDLWYQNKGIGEVAVLRKENRYIFYLITKRYSNGKPTMETITAAISSLRECCEEYKVTKLAMPRIGCGLDRLDWDEVKFILFSTFRDAGIEILVHVL